MFTPARAVQQRFSGARKLESPNSSALPAEDAPASQPDQADTKQKWQSLL